MSCHQSSHSWFSALQFQQHLKWGGSANPLRALVRIHCPSLLQQKAKMATRRQYGAGPTAQAEPVLHGSWQQCRRLGWPLGPPSEVPLNPGNSHATLPHLRDTAHKRTLSTWHSQLLYNEKGLGRERRHAERSLSSLGVFSLGSGSSFRVIFLQDIQRVWKDISESRGLQRLSVKRTDHIYFFKSMGRYSRIVRYRGKVNA